MIEPWLYGLLSGVVSGLIGAAGFGWWSGRNVVTKTDLESSVKAIYEQISAIRNDLSADFQTMEQAAKDDRHSARSNMDQRTEQFREKVDEMRDRYDTVIDRIHQLSTIVTRIDATVNNTPQRKQ